jgi:UDP-N-acetylglucosamine acyltransferase
LIHPSASVDPGARLGDGIEVGAGAVVGPDVEIGDGTQIGPYAIIHGPARIGARNRIHSFASIGDVPQDKKFHGEHSLLEMGDDNVVREFCTFNRGTDGGGGVTRIGSRNWIMAYVHLAHDCDVGSDVTMANGTTLAGHVRVEDLVTFGAFTVVHQFCAIGAHAFTAMGTVILKDVPPYVTVSGNSASPHGINAEGLRRRGFSPEALRNLRRAYKAIYRQGLTVDQALVRLRELEHECPEVAVLSSFINASRRGIVR